MSDTWQTVMQAAIDIVWTQRKRLRAAAVRFDNPIQFSAIERDVEDKMKEYGAYTARQGLTVEEAKEVLRLADRYVEIGQLALNRQK